MVICPWATCAESGSNTAHPGHDFCQLLEEAIGKVYKAPAAAAFQPYLNPTPSSTPTSILNTSALSMEQLQDDPFVFKHLSKLSPSLKIATANARGFWAERLAAVNETEGIIALLRTYLDNLSKLVYSARTRASSQQGERLHFVQHNHLPLRLHPQNEVNEYRPAIVATHLHPDDIRARTHDKYQLSWQSVECLVETIDEGEIFDTACMYQLLQARPDLIGVYFLVIKDGTSWAGWLDAQGIVWSQRYAGEQCFELLERWVYSLYIPPVVHRRKDPTIQLELPGVLQVTTWTITAGPQTYCNATLMSSECTPGHRTDVFRPSARDRVAIIKDTYLWWDKLHSESRLLQAVHSQGVIEAIASLKYSGVVLAKKCHACGTSSGADIGGGMFKMRLVFAADGSTWTDSKSVRDLCMAMFDLNEALRELARQGISHRNINPQSLLMYPVHDREWMRDAPNGVRSNSLKYIQAILSHEKPDAGTMGLLIDFTRATEMTSSYKVRSSNNDEEQLNERKETPGYWARSVVSLSVAPRSAFYVMPTLEGLAKDLYVKAYGSDVYDTWTDKPGQVHGVKPTPKAGAGYDMAFEYREEHDVESLFWVFIYTVLLATPEENDPVDTAEVQQRKAQKVQVALRCFREVKTGCYFDSRDTLLRMSKDNWEAVLPATLAPVIPLIMGMICHIWPEYARLEEQPAPGHLHEAFRRLLLDFIVNMDDPIALKPGASRYVPFDKDCSAELLDNMSRHHSWIIEKADVQALDLAQKIAPTVRLVTPCATPEGGELPFMDRILPPRQSYWSGTSTQRSTPSTGKTSSHISNVHEDDPEVRVTQSIVMAQDTRHELSEEFPLPKVPTPESVDQEKNKITATEYAGGAVEPVQKDNEDREHSPFNSVDRSASIRSRDPRIRRLAENNQLQTTLTASGVGPTLKSNDDEAQAKEVESALNVKRARDSSSESGSGAGVKEVLEEDDVEVGGHDECGL
ncbi:hypothetical protein BC835DRAFT_1416708 [Cytidiella melzeri]|nr:hypothetical protein BC835DRAFT_1416708 [Cytidiella melzeri]